MLNDHWPGRTTVPSQPRRRWWCTVSVNSSLHRADTPTAPRLPPLRRLNSHTPLRRANPCPLLRANPCRRLPLSVQGPWNSGCNPREDCISPPDPTPTPLVALVHPLTTFVALIRPVTTFVALIHPVGQKALGDQLWYACGLMACRFRTCACLVNGYCRKALLSPWSSKCPGAPCHAPTTSF